MMQVSPPTSSAPDTVLILGLLLGVGLLFVALLIGLIVAVVRRHGRAVWMVVLGLATFVVGVPLLASAAWLLVSYSSLQLSPAEVTVAYAINGHNSPVPPAAGELAHDVEQPRSEAAESGSSKIGYPRNRPSWLTSSQPPVVGIDAFTVSSDPYATRAEAIGSLNQRLASELARQAAEHVGQAQAGEIVAAHLTDVKQLLGLNASLAEFSQVTASEGVLRENVYLEQITFEQPLGEMYQAHALVVIDQSFLNYVDTHWQAAQARGRLAGVSLAVGGVMLGLLLFSAALRVGPRLAAKQRGRLQSGKQAAILLLVVVTSLVAR